MLLGILSGLLLSACAQPPDVPICVKLSDAKGWCTNTITSKEFYVDNDKLLFEGKTWSQVDELALRVPASSWAQIKAYILKNCKKNQDCANNIGTWQRKADALDKSLAAPKPKPTPSPTPVQEEDDLDSDFAKVNNPDID